MFNGNYYLLFWLSIRELTNEVRLSSRGLKEFEVRPRWGLHSSVTA